MNEILFPIIALAGGFFLVRNILLLRSDAKLQRFLEGSPVGRQWTTRLGAEKTIRLAKTIFLPVGILVSLVLLGIGLSGILMLLNTSA